VVCVWPIKARVLVSLASIDDDDTGGLERFEASSLGSAEEVSQDYVSDKELLIFRVCCASHNYHSDCTTHDCSTAAAAAYV
jgi:hypothetical protein